MRWRDHWPERIPRPKAKRLSGTEKSTLLAAMTRAIGASPVLSYLGVRVRAGQGRFYLEKEWKEDDEPVVEIMGRITPLLSATGALLLEVESRSGRWSEVATGSAQKLINAVANDTKGSFHGLGSVNKVLRKAGKGLSRLPVKKQGKCKFVYSATGAVCTPQEALFHYFGLPLEIIAEPSKWYSYHRVPKIVETRADKKRVLVRFTASDSMEEFFSTCLYAVREDTWDAYAIRPNASGSIAKAEAWLVQRKWQGW